MPSDLNSKCRTCLCESNSYYQLFDYVEEKYIILEMLDCVVPQIDIKMPSQFSSFVCPTCVEKLLIGYKFQQTCIETHNRLHDLLGIVVLETPTKLEKILDPLNAESNLKMKKELDEETNSFLDDSDSSNEKLSTLKKKSSELNRHKGHFSCTECGQVLRSLNQLKQHIGKHNSNGDIQEPNLASIFEEKTNAVLEKNLKANIKQERKSTLRKLDTECKNSSDTSRDEHFLEPRESQITNNDFVVTAEVKKINIRKRSYPCEVCGKIFDGTHRLKRHSLVHNIARQHECKICKYRFATANLLKNHLLRQTHSTGEKFPAQPQTAPFKCPDCPRQFKKHAALSAHRLSHTSNTSKTNYPCTVCQRCFMSKRSLTEHITNKHPEVVKHKCDQCDKTFFSHAHLVEHLNRHNVVCLICEKKFAYKKNLKEHMRTHSGENPYLCPQCGKTFRSASNLSQHMERHTVLKKYQCTECPSRFKCKAYLVKHAITHTNAKPHVCDICGSHFRRTTSLQKHKLLHSGERPFKCDQCSMTFAVIYHLRRHMRTHTGEKPYKCKFCERAYAESGDLTKHLRTHVGENTYMCDQCPMAFKYQAELRKHQSQHYKITQKLLEKED